MTDFEREIATALGGCRLVPGSFDKSFAADMSTKPTTFVPTDRQRGALLLLAWKYRRQIGLTLDADNKARRITRLILSEIEREPDSLRGFHLPRELQEVFRQATALREQQKGEVHA